jgi:acyl-CoA dehydrogenase
MNDERILNGAECIGDAHWFIQKTSDYAKNREVFNRPIGKNQRIQFPIARAYAQSEAADLMVHKATTLFDTGKLCGKEANMAKLLATDASWEVVDVYLQTLGGFGFAEKYDIERKFRETRLYRIAAVSTNLILSYLAEHVLGLPRSF